MPCILTWLTYANNGGRLSTESKKSPRMRNAAYGGNIEQQAFRRVSWWIRWWRGCTEYCTVGSLVWKQRRCLSSQARYRLVNSSFHIYKSLETYRSKQTSSGSTTPTRLLCKPNKLCRRYFHILFWRCWESEFGSPAFELSDDLSLVNSHWHWDAMPSVDLQIVSFDGRCRHLRNLIGVVVLAGWIINEHKLWSYAIDEIVKESMYGVWISIAGLELIELW